MSRRQVDVPTLGVAVDTSERLHHCMTSREDTVCQQKCVEKVDA